MLTPLDQIATKNHLQIAKAAVPYLPPSHQPLLSVLIKFMEVQNILRFYNQKKPVLTTCSTQNETVGIVDILSEMRNYCEGTDQEMLDQWIQLTGTIELYSIFSSSERSMS